MRRSTWGNIAEGAIPRGRLSVADLGPEYVVKLDMLARKWGCETLSEAGIELLKDAIDEEVRKGMG